MDTQSTLTPMAECKSTIRKTFAPKAAGKGVVSEECTDCGKDFLRATGRKRFRCADCAALRETAATNQMQHRSGPIYIMSLRRQMDHCRAELRRLNAD